MSILSISHLIQSLKSIELRMSNTCCLLYFWIFLTSLAIPYHPLSNLLLPIEIPGQLSVRHWTKWKHMASVTEFVHLVLYFKCPPNLVVHPFSNCIGGGHGSILFFKRLMCFLNWMFCPFLIIEFSAILTIYV